MAVYMYSSLFPESSRNPFGITPPTLCTKCVYHYRRAESNQNGRVDPVERQRLKVELKSSTELQCRKREKRWNGRLYVTDAKTNPGPLATYSSLQDKHLVGYFNNSRMRRHLRRSGLVTRNGEIITENSFRLNMARKEHQKHVRDLMAQAIVHKALDMERHRQSQIKRKLEEISKVELVQRVRSTRGRKGDEDITPYLSPRAPGARPKSAKQERPRSVVSGHRPATAPSKHAGASKKKSSVYVDHEGFPVHRDQAWAETASDSDEEIDSQNLRELDPYIMNNITLNMSPEERRSNSPYKVDLTLPPEPRPPTRAPPGSRKTPRVSSSRSVITKDGRRIRPKSNKGSLSLHRKEPAYPHAAQQQTLCDVTIKYRGSNLKLQYERQDKRDEIVINQQHCGGGNLVVFHGLVEPGTDLVFTSRRHRGYPFSLTFFLNQIQVLRLSACCEYKYGPGVLLGGRKGHFKFGRVDGGSPCYKCMVEAELARRERQRYKDTQTEEPKPEPEPEPILESQGTQSDPPPPETRDQNEQAEADEETKDAEGGYDDEDFEEEDGAQADSEKEDASKTEDKNSDHFFSGPESDTEQKQPDDVDYDADSDFEVESNHGKQKEEEKDEEIKEEVKEEGDEEDAKKEASEDEPIHSEIEADEDSKEDEGAPQEVLMEEEVPEEKEEPKVREEEQGTEAGRQSSAFDSDSDSDGEDHNKVLSSSSSSSSEDEADQKAPATIVTSSSDSDSDDDAAGRKTKKVEDDVKEEQIPSKDEEHDFVREEVEDTDKDVQASAEEAISVKDDDEDTNTKKVKQEDDIKEEEIPPKDEEKDVQREEEEDKNADKIQSSAEETIPAEDGEEVESKDEEKKPDLRAHLKDVVNFDDSADDDVQANQKRDQPLSSTVNPEDTKTDKEADDDIQEENNATKEKQDGDDKEESEKEEKTFGDKIKSMFGSSDSDSSSSDSSSSSSSDSDSERKKKNKHRKKKGEAKKEDTQVHVETKSGSDSKKEEIKAESKEEDAITQDDSSKEDASTLAEVDHSEDEKEKTEDAISADEQPETGATMQKEEKEDRDEDSQSQSEKLVIDEENDNDKDKGDTVSLGKDSLSENRNDAQTKDDTEMQDSDTEKEDHQKSEEPDQDEASQSQSERLVDDEEKDDTASLQNDAASENVDDGGVQTKDDEEKSESDVGRLAPHVLIEEATSDEEQKEDDQDADNSTSVDKENKIDEDDEKQTTDTEKEDVHSNKEEDNDAGSNEKEADEEQHTTEDEGAMGKEEDSKEEVQEKENREQNEEVEAKQDEVKDEDKTDEGPKEEVNPEGSQSSRSSASESGSIATGLDKNYRILNLNAKNMDERKAGKLAKALKKHKYRNLEYLLLRENSLTDTGLATVIRSLIERHNESTSADSTLKLTHMDLGNSGMGEESAAELARLLTLDTPLRNLNISENELSTAAWASIIDHIKRNKSLVTFSAEYAHLSDTSCVMLMEALSDHEKLEELNIEGNGLGERAGKAVAQLVKDNSIIISVNFERDNSISPQILAEVKEILETGSYVP
ncbi:glutamate-rich protein 3-like isoform X1 [Asterias rubens]|uniref:glutamate-rich protein 3-like isoform X1 n=1 Tax=Asterias rubens TaxID=7604 RepID=UPI00145562BD|nr:glutamate-rich protein 3-like isoform X1 [Asterias rubens]